MIPIFKPFYDVLEKKAVDAVLENGFVSEGEATKEFERLVAKRFGREFGIAVTSGTVALMIAAKLEAIHAVYVPDYCFIAPYNAVKLAGKSIELIDIDKETLSNASVVKDYDNIFVHFNNKKSMVKGRIIHDVSHCIGADFTDLEGTLCVSFSAPKTITTGQGGMILTNNKYLANEMRRFKNHGKLAMNDESKDMGGNYKFNDILASVGIEQMVKLDYMLDYKKAINEEYNKYIKTFNPPVPWVIMYQHPKARELSKHLLDNGIEARCFYKPIHRLVRSVREDMPNADWASENLVYLPSYVGLSNEDIKYICEVINNYGS